MGNMLPAHASAVDMLMDTDQGGFSPTTAAHASEEFFLPLQSLDDGGLLVFAELREFANLLN